MKRKWAEIEVVYLRENLEEKTVPQLAQQLERSSSSVSRKLVELGLTKGRKAKAKDCWTEEETRILKDFWDKVSLEELAKKVGRSVLATKGKKNLLGLSKKNLVNIEFFNEETPEKYYVLGYVFADSNLYIGTNGSGNPTYSFSLYSVDAKELQQILAEIAPARSIYLSKTNLLHAFKLTNEKIYKSLVQYGLHLKKSCTIQFPNILDRFLGEFLRGYFDGDGWFSYVKST